MKNFKKSLKLKAKSLKLSNLVAWSFFLHSMKYSTQDIILYIRNKTCKNINSLYIICISEHITIYIESPK